MTYYAFPACVRLMLKISNFQIVFAVMPASTSVMINPQSEFNSFTIKDLESKTQNRLVEKVPEVIMEPGESQPKKITYNKEVTRKELEEDLLDCDKLRFVGFDLTPKFLGNLLEVLQKNKKQVRSLAFKSCKISDMKKIATIVQDCKCETLTLSDCHLSTEQLKEFTYTKIFKLNLSSTDFTENGMVDQVAKLVAGCNVSKLVIRDCNISDKELEFFHSLAKIPLDHLDMSYNNLTTEGMKTLGSMVKNCEIKTLILDDCHLEDEHLSAFYDACSDGKLRKLLLRDNPLISDGAVLMKLIRGHNISDLNMSDCSLGTETIKEMLENIEDYQFTTLDLSVSDEIVTEIRAKVLAQIAKLVKKTLWLCFDEVSEKYQKIIEEGIKENLVCYTY